MLTANQTETALPFPLGKVVSAQRGAATSSSPLFADMAAPGDDRGGLFQALIAYLSGSGLPAEGVNPLQASGGDGKQPGSFLPGSGDSLPPGLSRERLVSVAEALGMDVGQLLHEVMKLAGERQGSEAHPDGKEGSLVASLAAMSSPATGSDMQSQGRSGLHMGQSESQPPSAHRLQAYLQHQLQHSPQPVMARGEPARPPAAEQALAQSPGQSLQQFLNDTAPVSGSGTETRTATQAAALHAALQKALGERGGQSVSDLTRAQVPDARTAESPLTGLAALSQTQSSGTGTERPVTGGTINAPLNQPAWGEEMGQRIRWMVGNNIQSATLKINPPQLGPLDVRISVHHDHMSIVFTAHHALVREALEDSAPRLRDMMGDKGFDTVDVDVSGGSPSGDGRSADAGDGDDTSLAGHAGGDGKESRDTVDHDPDGLSGAPTLASVMNGRVDFYA